jgi:hypothetical protein
MKQHLETHYKDKARAAGSQRAHKAALVEARRNSMSGRSRSAARESGPWETEQYALPTPPLPSPNGVPAGAWDMRGLNLPLMSRPSSVRTPSSGLDALAMAILTPVSTLCLILLSCRPQRRFFITNHNHQPLDTPYRDPLLNEDMNFERIHHLFSYLVSFVSTITPIILRAYMASIAHAYMRLALLIPHGMAFCLFSLMRWVDT